MSIYSHRVVEVLANSKVHTYTLILGENSERKFIQTSNNSLRRASVLCYNEAKMIIINHPYLHNIIELIIMYTCQGNPHTCTCIL